MASSAKAKHHVVAHPVFAPKNLKHKIGYDKNEEIVEAYMRMAQLNVGGGGAEEVENKSQISLTFNEKINSETINKLSIT